MPLSPASKQIVENWVKAQCPSFKCAACSGTSHDINDILVCSPKAPGVGSLVGRGPATEFVPIVCKTCGFVMFFSVKSIGLTV